MSPEKHQVPGKETVKVQEERYNLRQEGNLQEVKSDEGCTEVLREYEDRSYTGEMIPIDPVGILLIILCAFFLYFSHGKNKNDYQNFPPGPKPLPIIGNMHILDTERPLDTILQLSEQYGSVFSIQVGTKKTVVLCGYETVKEALVNHAEEFSGRAKLPIFQDVTQGYGIVFSHGENWKVMRRFTISKLRDFGMGKKTIENKINEECDALVQKFHSYKGELFENTAIMNGAVANIIASILLGHRFDYDDPTILRLLHLINENVRLLGSPIALLSEKYGPVFSIQLGTDKMVVLCGYETVKDALVNYAEEFSDRAFVPVLHEISRGYGVIFSNGENWKVMRRFTLSTLRDFGMGKKIIEEKINEECDSLVEMFKSYNGEPFDNTIIINTAVANIIVSILLGHRFDYKNPTLLKLIHLINQNVRLLGSRMIMLYNAYPSVMRWLPGSHKTVFKNAEELQSFVIETFTKQKDQLDLNDQRNLIDAFLVKQQEENPELFFNNENLVSLVSNLFVAGTETTSTTLRWGLLLMAKYPEIQKKVKDEIVKVIGSAQPQVEHRKLMPYTDAVIHEIQRFGNIIPGNLPHATSRDITFRGYFIPKGTHVIPLLTSVLQDKTYFEKPDQFYPQHFLDSKGNFMKNEAFLPFSTGRRSCAGENLAKMELFLFFTRLMQQFTFHPPTGVEVDLSPISGFTRGPSVHEICAYSIN
ncbi:cytochrome P450 2K6-like [Spea bombifrons]|uniref:cytochrome P450 2K6-like n=1 Tax=Spea bombifrons TaxID=233779 RepID=UPI00234ADB44|nr:cytochrome P450 2K6-like [Spea bombifrons]